jgi:hypothetical protein
MEEPERLRSLNLAWFAIDELTYCKEASFVRLLGRLRHPKAKFLTGFAACSPNGFDFVYDRFIGEKKTSDYAAIRASPKENFHLASGYYEELAHSYDEKFYRQEVLGEFLSLRSGTVYHAFDRSRNIDSTILYNPNAQLAWALDFNYGLMCSVIFQILDFSPTDFTSSQRTRKVEVLDEICIPDGTIDMACSAFVDRVKQFHRTSHIPKAVRIYGDPAGNAHHHSGATDWGLVKQYFLREPGFALTYLVTQHEAHPLVRDRVNTVNAALFNANGETRLTIHPRCKGLIKDLERVMWAQDSHENVLGAFDKTDKTLTHVSDGLGYAIAKEFPLMGGSYGYQSTRII